MTPIPLALSRAVKFADAVVGELAGHCSEILVVGSIRRKCPTVGDVDIVALPLDDLARARMRACVLQRAPEIMQDGPNQLLVILATKAGPVQLDLWFAARPVVELFATVPGNLGTLVMCRTGSQAHNIWLASKAKTKGWHWNPYKGLYNNAGVHVAGETEASIYQALDLGFIQPEARL